jgi:hypothetical protein
VRALGFRLWALCSGSRLLGCEAFLGTGLWAVSSSLSLGCGLWALGCGALGEAGCGLWAVGSGRGLEAAVEAVRLYLHGLWALASGLLGWPLGWAVGSRL